MTQLRQQVTADLFTRNSPGRWQLEDILRGGPQIRVQTKKLGAIKVGIFRQQGGILVERIASVLQVHIPELLS